MKQPDPSWPIRRFLARLASTDPAPGGGSAAALAGCLACALGSMVSRILISRAGIRSAEKKKLKIGLKEMERARAKLAGLIRRDAETYAGLVTAQRRGGRSLQAARVRAVECPLEICRQTAGAMHPLQALLKNTGPYLGSDVRAGQDLLRGAFSSAREMASINLRGSGFGPEGRKLQAELERLERIARRWNGRA